MAVTRGQKYWRLWPREYSDLLYPTCAAGAGPATGTASGGSGGDSGGGSGGRSDWLFPAHPLRPSEEVHPAAALADCWEGVVEGAEDEPDAADSASAAAPGDLLFVPADCPHYVQNLSDTIAISCNYVDGHNAARALAALAVDAWTDPSAGRARAALLEKEKAAAAEDRRQRRQEDDEEEDKEGANRGVLAAVAERSHTPYHAMNRRSNGPRNTQHSPRAGQADLETARLLVVFEKAPSPAHD
jgi:hypothetical protein